MGFSSNGARRLVLLAALCCIGVLGGSSVASAATQQLTTVVNFGGAYGHTYTITVNCDGSFSGTGSYDGDASYTETISGTISGGSISGTAIYTGGDPGYQYSFNAPVDSSGNFSGTGSSNTGQTFDSVTGTGATVPTCRQHPAVTSKDQCKNGGWMNYSRANDTPFKNQGDCVSYTENGK